MIKLGHGLYFVNLYSAVSAVYYVISIVILLAFLALKAEQKTTWGLIMQSSRSVTGLFSGIHLPVFTSSFPRPRSKSA